MEASKWYEPHYKSRFISEGFKDYEIWLVIDLPHNRDFAVVAVYHIESDSILFQEFIPRSSLWSRIFGKSYEDSIKKAKGRAHKFISKRIEDEKRRRGIVWQ